MQKQQKCDYESYRRVKLLGEGSFGKAYLVECLRDQSKWVIKQMSLSAMTEQEKKDTVKEAKILEALSHPNIVQFREVYKTKKGKLCIVMEYADGGDISEIIKEQAKKRQLLDENYILDLFTQICLALKHVHDRKILHRDLKGQNIFMTSNNRIKLGDFGIAKVLNKTFEKARTMVGTPYYLSPEILENRPYSFKSDIWSLGVILYELCALKPPFNAENMQQLAMKIVRGQYNQIPSQYSRDMKNLVMSMLKVDSDTRPSVHDILKAPIIQNRIRQFLSESVKKDEFMHTILHNQKFVNQKAEIGNLKLVQNEQPCPQHLLSQHDKPQDVKVPSIQKQTPEEIRPQLQLPSKRDIYTPQFKKPFQGENDFKKNNFMNKPRTPGNNYTPSQLDNNSDLQKPNFMRKSPNVREQNRFECLRQEKSKELLRQPSAPQFGRAQYQPQPQPKPQHQRRPSQKPSPPLKIDYSKLPKKTDSSQTPQKSQKSISKQVEKKQRPPSSQQQLIRPQKKVPDPKLKNVQYQQKIQQMQQDRLKEREERALKQKERELERLKMHENIDVKRKTLKQLEGQDLFNRKEFMKVEYYEKEEVQLRPKTPKRLSELPKTPTQQQYQQQVQNKPSKKIIINKKLIMNSDENPFLNNLRKKDLQDSRPQTGIRDKENRANQNVNQYQEMKNLVDKANGAVKRMDSKPSIYDNNNAQQHNMKVQQKVTEINNQINSSPKRKRYSENLNLQKNKQDNEQFDQEYNRFRSLRTFLEGKLGLEQFEKAYRTLKKEFIRNQKDVEKLQKAHGSNNYAKLLPFIDQELLKTYAQLVITLLVTEDKL